MYFVLIIYFLQVQDDQIVCGCTHLTAFSALFVDNSIKCEEWEWDTLRTVAASLIAFIVFFVIIFLIVEYFVVYKKRRERLRRRVKTKKGGNSRVSGKL